MTLMGMVAAVGGHTETTVKRSPEGVFICAAEDMLQINKDMLGRTRGSTTEVECARKCTEYKKTHM